MQIKQFISSSSGGGGGGGGRSSVTAAATATTATPNTTTYNSLGSTLSPDLEKRRKNVLQETAI